VLGGIDGLDTAWIQGKTFMYIYNILVRKYILRWPFWRPDKLKKCMH